MIAAGQREKAVAFRAAVLLPILKRNFQRDLDRGRAIVAVEDAVEPVRALPRRACSASSVRTAEQWRPEDAGAHAQGCYTTTSHWHREPGAHPL
jgi:hypothetical protein